MASLFPLLSFDHFGTTYFVRESAGRYAARLWHRGDGPKILDVSIAQARALCAFGAARAHWPEVY